MVSIFLPAVLPGLVGSNTVAFSHYDFFVLLISSHYYNLLLTEICSATAIHFWWKKSQVTIKHPFSWKRAQSLSRRTWLDKASWKPPSWYSLSLIGALGFVEPALAKKASPCWARFVVQPSYAIPSAPPTQTTTTKLEEVWNANPTTTTKEVQQPQSIQYRHKHTHTHTYTHTRTVSKETYIHFTYMLCESCTVK